MEDIEYLDEYKDLVMPDIGSQSSENRVSAGNAQGSGTRLASRIRQASSDSSSSSIDADIFQKLFHGKLTSDELWKDGDTISKDRPRYDSSSSDSNDALDALYNRNVRKTKSKPWDRMESFDSIDDLGVVLMRSSTKPTANKGNTIGAKLSAKKLTGEPSSSENSQTFKSKSIRGRPPGKPKAVAKKPSTVAKTTFNNKNGTFTSISPMIPSVKNTKAVTIIKPQKPKVTPAPKKDPLNLLEFFGESESDSSYEYESDIYDDRDTDDETEHVIDISTDSSTTASVADDVTPVVSEDESHPSNGDSERLQLYLSNLDIAEALTRTPISKKHNSAKKTRSSEKSSSNSTPTEIATTPEINNQSLDTPLKAPTSTNEQVIESKDGRSANAGLEESESTESPTRSQKFISSSIAKNIDSMHVSPRADDNEDMNKLLPTSIDYDDSNLTYEKLERMSLDLAEQIMDIDAERTIEFQKRSGSKPRSIGSKDIVPQGNTHHIRQLTYSNEELNDDDIPSGSNLRRVKSDNFMPKRKRGRPPKVRSATTEETLKAKIVEISDNQHLSHLVDDKSNVNLAVDSEPIVPSTEKEKSCQTKFKQQKIASTLSKSKKVRSKKLIKKAKTAKLKSGDKIAMQESGVHESMLEKDDQEMEQTLNEKLEKCMLECNDEVQVMQASAAQHEIENTETEIISNENESNKLIMKEEINVETENDVHEEHKKEEGIAELTKNTEAMIVNETEIQEFIETEDECCNLNQALENATEIEEHSENIPELEKVDENVLNMEKKSAIESVNIELPKSEAKDDLLESAHSSVTCKTGIQEEIISDSSASLKPKIPMEETEKPKMPHTEKEIVLEGSTLEIVEESVQEDETFADASLQKSVQEENTIAPQIEIPTMLEAATNDDEVTSHSAELAKVDERTTDTKFDIHSTDKPKLSENTFTIETALETVKTATAEEAIPGDLSGIGDKPDANEMPSTSTKKRKSRSSKRLRKSESETPVVEKILRSSSLLKTQDLNEKPEKLTLSEKALQKCIVSETEKVTQPNTETATQSTTSNDGPDETPLVNRRSRRIKFCDIIKSDHPVAKPEAPSEQGVDSDMTNLPSAKKDKNNVTDEIKTQSKQTRVKKLFDRSASPKRETRNSSKEQNVEKNKVGTKQKTHKEPETKASTKTAEHISSGNTTVQISELKTPAASNSVHSVRSCKKVCVRIKKTPIPEIDLIGTKQNIVDEKEISDKVTDMEKAAKERHMLDKKDEKLLTTQIVNEKENPKENNEDITMKIIENVAENQFDITERNAEKLDDVEATKLVEVDTDPQADIDVEKKQEETEIGVENSSEVSFEQSADVSPKGLPKVSSEESAEVSAVESAEVRPEESAEISVEESAEISPEQSAVVNVEELAEIGSEELAEVSPEESGVAVVSHEESVDFSHEESAEAISHEKYAEVRTELSAAEANIESTIKNCEDEQLSKRSTIKPNSTVEFNSLSTTKSETETIGVTANVKVQVEEANELNKCQTRSLRKRETEASSQSDDAGKRKQTMASTLLKQQHATKLKKVQEEGDQGAKNLKLMPPPASPASSASKALRKRRQQDELAQPDVKRTKLTQSKIYEYGETLKGDAQYHGVMGKDAQKTQTAKAGQSQAKLSDIKATKKTIIAGKKSEQASSASNTAEKKILMRDLLETGEALQLSKSAANVSKVHMASRASDNPRVDKKSLSSPEIANKLDLRKSEATKANVSYSTESPKHIVMGKKLKAGLGSPSRKSSNQTHAATINKQTPQPKSPHNAIDSGRKQIGHSEQISKKIEARKSEPSKIVKLMSETSDNTTISAGKKLLNIGHAGKKSEHRKSGTQTAPHKVMTTLSSAIEGGKVAHKSASTSMKKGDSRKPETQAAGVKFKLSLPVESQKQAGNATTISGRKSLAQSEATKKIDPRKSEPVKTGVTVAPISKAATSKFGLKDPLALPNADVGIATETETSKDQSSATVIPIKQTTMAKENQTDATFSTPPIRFQTLTRAASSTRSLSATPTLLLTSDRRNNKQKVADDMPASENFNTDDKQSGVVSAQKVAQEKQQSRSRSGSRKRKAQNIVGSAIEGVMDTDQNAKRMNLATGNSTAFPVRITVASSQAAPLDTGKRGTISSNNVPLVAKSAPFNCRKLYVRVSRTIVKKWSAAQKQNQADAPVQPLAEAAVESQAPVELQKEIQAPVADVCGPEQVVAISGDGDCSAGAIAPDTADSLATPSPGLQVETSNSIEISSDEASMPNNYRSATVNQGTENVVNAAQRMPLPVIMPDLEVKPETNVDAAVSVLAEQEAAQITPAATVTTAVPESTTSTKNAHSTLPSATTAVDGQIQSIGTTKFFSFLYPQRFQRGLGEVGLDFCCPNLDGPMRAIDPTRLHSKVQVPVLELPQFVVMTTKIISKDETNIPNKVRAKLEQMAAADGLPSEEQTLNMNKNAPHTTAKQPPTAAASVPAVSAIVPTVPPTVKVAPQLATAATASTPPVLSKQLPRSMILAKNQIHPVSTNTVPTVHPTLLQLPPICPKDKQRVELQSRVQLFDLVLQNLIKRAATLTVAEREATIEEMVRTSSLLPIDVDMGTKLLENYVHYLNIATNAPASTSQLRLSGVVTPTISTGQNVGVVSSMGQPETSLPPAAAVNKSVMPTSTPPTASKRHVRPIYGPDKHIIGYQCAPLSGAHAISANTRSPMPQVLPVAQNSSVTSNTLAAVKTKLALAHHQTPRNMPTNTLSAPMKEFFNARDSPHQLILPNTPSPSATLNINKASGSTTSMLQNDTYLRTAVGKSPTSELSSAESSSTQAFGSSRNVFIVNQMPQLEECILPDAVSNTSAAPFIDLESSIKSEVDDIQETIT